MPKIVPYSNIANKIGVWVPINQLSRELNPLCEGAFIELYELINNKYSVSNSPILPGTISGSMK